MIDYRAGDLVKVSIEDDKNGVPDIGWWEGTISAVEPGRIEVEVCREEVFIITLDSDGYSSLIAPPF